LGVGLYSVSRFGKRTIWLGGAKNQGEATLLPKFQAELGGV